MNSLSDYNNFVRNNLPTGVTYAGNRYRFNNKSFLTYDEAVWYKDYLSKFSEEGGEIHVFVLAGQSNTIGLNTTDGLNTFPVGTQQYNQSNLLEAASSPLDHFSTIPENSGSIAYDVQLVRQYIEDNPGVQVVLIPCAQGGTGFSNNRWNKGDDLYEATVSRINTFASTYPNATFKGVVWFQGERDALENWTQVQYEVALMTMIMNLRLDAASVASVPFYALEIGVDPTSNAGAYPGADNIRAAIRALVGLVTNYNYVSAWGAFEDDTDNLHFGPRGQRRMGDRVANLLAGRGTTTGGIVASPLLRDPSFDDPFQWYTNQTEYNLTGGGILSYDSGGPISASHEIHSRFMFYAQVGQTIEFSARISNYNNTASVTKTIKGILVQYTDLDTEAFTFVLNEDANGTYTAQHTFTAEGPVHLRITSQPKGGHMQYELDNLSLVTI